MALLERERRGSPAACGWIRIDKQETFMAEQGFTPPTSEWYHPSADMVKQANVQDYEAEYERAMKDPEAFWAACAEKLEWYQKWDKVLDDSNKPFYKWFVGGKTNMVLNALDRHVKTWRRNKLAIIWEGEDGEKVTLSYWRLWQEVNKFANVLRSMGVAKGDRVTIYMGRVPEIAIAMLACAKIGAPHSVVYGGFSEQALASRIEDAQSKVLDHLRRRLAARQDRAAQGHGRRSGAALARGGNGDRGPAYRARHQYGAGTRLSGIMT